MITNPVTTQQTPITASPALLVMTPLTYNYKAELNCLSLKIETKLTKYFEALFTQMDKKIDKIVQQQNTKHDEQVKVNIQVAKQLSFFVDNMQCFLIYDMPQQPQTSPLPHNGKAS